MCAFIFGFDFQILTAYPEFILFPIFFVFLFNSVWCADIHWLHKKKQNSSIPSSYNFVISDKRVIQFKMYMFFIILYEKNDVLFTGFSSNKVQKKTLSKMKKINLMNSVCDFQSIKSSDELKNQFSKQISHLIKIGKWGFSALNS